MSDAIIFTEAAYHNCFSDFSCRIATGTAAILVTDTEQESHLLCRLLTGMSQCGSGSLEVLGTQLHDSLSSNDLQQLRQQIGIISASGVLIANLKLWENIVLPTLYHHGSVLPEQEAYALKLLSSFGYTGKLMAQPATLTLPEKRMAAVIRAAILKPRLMVYSHALDDLPEDLFDCFLQVAQELHTTDAAMTTLYLTSSHEVLKRCHDLPVMQLHRNETATRRL